VVLDIACGSGYGTELLAKTAKKVYGVDVDEQAVAYASQYFAAKNIAYKIGDGVSIPLEDNSVDVVVTFETIEHIQDYKTFIKEIKRVLKPDGLAVVSTPNDLEFAEGNHFHIHEFTYSELISLLRRDFANIDSYYQATWKYVAIGPDSLLQQSGELQLPTLNLAPPMAREYLYFYLVCSNRDITEKIKPLGSLGEHYSDRQIRGRQAQFAETLQKTELELQRLRGRYNKQAEALKHARSELTAIMNSRAYRLARHLARAKQGLTRHVRK